MKKLLYITLLLAGTGLYGQINPDMLHVRTKTYLDADGSSTLDIIQYYDDAGRPVQLVERGITPSGADLVTARDFDTRHREIATRLPFPVQGNNGAFVTGVLEKGRAFYGDQSPYTKITYDNAHSEAVAATYGPGQDWHRTYGSDSKAVKTEYMANMESGVLSCARYTCGIRMDISIRKTGMYPAGSLWVAKTTDEDGHISYEFKDMFGQVVLIRQMNDAAQNDTYYVYDDFGMLKAVLPPAASDALTAVNTTWTESTAAIGNYAYLYRYDDYNRCVQKKLPGCEPVEMRYDREDRLVFSQDANRRARNEWIFFLYDALGRQVVSGIWVSATVPDLTNTVVKANYDSTPTGTKLGGYNVNLNLPATVRLMTVSYYDNYRFLDLQMSATRDSLAFSAGGGISQFAEARGLPTGSRTYRLDDPSRYSVAAIYHDLRDRVIQTRASNHLGGYDREYSTHTFTGKIRQRRLEHWAPGKKFYAETYAYDYGTPQANPTERLLSVRHKVNNAAEVTLSQYSYDEAGRTKTKKVANETSTYHYNIRGWLTQVTGTKFNQTLTYNAPVNGVTPAKALYNGNISAMKWKSGDETTERGYKFSYDGMDRLAAATYGEGTAITTNLNRFNETVTYNDKMGNIGTLQRRGNLNGVDNYGLMDNLAYAYTGNRLTKVTDAVTTPITYQGAFHFVDRANVANEYAYDDNGNLTKDLNRNITSITYNELNLPGVITFSGNRSITYGYDAAGNKLSVAYLSDGEPTKMEYAGNRVYNNNMMTTLLTDEGYIDTGTTPAYHYHLRDHQGNNRVVVNQAGTVEEVNHYYPFGGVFSELARPSIQRYKYNGKELDRKFDLDMLDYGARHYDPALGRWFTVDPMAEKYYSISPYVYVDNNPIIYVDWEGREKLIYYHYPTINSKHAAMYPDNKAINVFTHGKNTLLKLEGFAGISESKVTSGEGLNKLLSRDSETWQNRKEGEQLTIILYSCDVAEKRADGSSLAEQLSSSPEFRDHVIIAPDRKFFLRDDKDKLQYIGVYGAKYQNRLAVQDKTDMGNWLVYQNGKVIRTIPGNQMPGQEEEEDDKPTWGEVYDFMRRAIKANPGIVVK